MFSLIFATKALRLFITSVCVSKVLFPVESSSGREESSGGGGGYKYFYMFPKIRCISVFLYGFLEKTLFHVPV